MRFLLTSLICAVFFTSAASQAFTDGEFFTTDYSSNRINRFDENGFFIDSFDVPASYALSVRGLAFGPDNLLYFVAVTDTGFSVIRTDGEGDFTKVASGNTYLRGNISYGAIAISGDGDIYVAGQGSLTRFESGVAIGEVVYSGNQIFDVEILPNGNLLVISAYDLVEILSDGTNVDSLGWFSSGRGVEYDPESNAIFTTELGHSGAPFQLKRIDRETKAIEQSEYFWYGNDIFLTKEGSLLVGSRTQAPALFDADLNQLAIFGSIEQMFVTQYIENVVQPAPFVLRFMEEINHDGEPRSFVLLNQDPITYTLHSYGSQLGRWEDGFHYLYEPLSGDITIEARIASISEGWSSGGIMIRDTLDPGSKFSAIEIESMEGARYKSRLSEYTPNPAIDIPDVTEGAWLRLVKHGNIVSSYVSHDGMNWVFVTSEEIAFSEEFTIGVFGISSKFDESTEVVVDNVSVTIF